MNIDTGNLKIDLLVFEVFTEKYENFELDLIFHELITSLYL